MKQSAVCITGDPLHSDIPVVSAVCQNVWLRCLLVECSLVRYVNDFGNIFAVISWGIFQPILLDQNDEKRKIPKLAIGNRVLKSIQSYKLIQIMTF